MGRQNQVQKRTKQSFLHGALILLMATLIVKVIGAVFKIPLGNLLGEEGFGYFNFAYNMFTPLYSLAMAGLPVAVSKMVSECAARGRFRDIKRVMRISSTAFVFTGSMGTLIMLFGARIYSDLIIKAPDAFLSIILLAPAVFFCCTMSSHRGYYEGLKNMYPTAISQVIEAIAKLVLGLGLAVLVMWWGNQQYFHTGRISPGLTSLESGSMVFGRYCGTRADALSAIYPVSSAGAILGITLSTLAGSLYLFFRHRLRGDGITRSELAAAPPPRPIKVLFIRLVKIAIPVSLGALAITITAFIDASTVVNRLVGVVEKSPEILREMYKGIEDRTSEIPTFLYGAYGFAVSIFNLVPTITTTFGISALPAVTTAWTVNNMKETKRSVESVLRITSLVAFPAGIGISVLAGPILKLLYSSPERALGVFIATPVLQLLGVGVIFVALLTPINSMLQAVGRADLPVKLMLVGGSIKIVTNFILVSIPTINIKGAPIGTILCYVFLVVSSLYYLCKRTRMVPDFSSVFFKPLLAAAFCGVAAWVSHALLSRVSTSRMVTLISIVLAAIVYAICLFVFRAISKSDVLMLPKGEKIAKILEKKGLIG